MNYLAHGRRFVEEEYVLAGTALPDWLGVVDRSLRARSTRAAEQLAHEEPAIAAVARGVVRHHADDRWFHGTRAFVELNLEFAVRIRDRLPQDEGFRPSFLGHILVEILLDDCLAAESPGLLDAYYRAVERIDASTLTRAVELLVGRPTPNLAPFVERFCRERFLYDYADDGKLLTRLNAVLRRVKLPPLPDEFRDLLPEARRDVARRRSELLAGETSHDAP